MNENTWEVAALKTIKDLGGNNVKLQDIYDNINRYVPITPDLEIITYRRPKYHHVVRAILSDLAEKNQVGRVNRSVYSISAEGSKRLEKPERIIL